MSVKKVYFPKCEQRKNYYLRIDSKEELMDYLMKYLDDKENFMPITIHSCFQTGKSELLKEIRRKYLELYPDKEVALVKCYDFKERIIDEIRNWQLNSYQKELLDKDLLLFDDLDFLQCYERTCEQFSILLDRKYDREGKVIITTPYAIDELKIGDRLYHKLKYGGTYIDYVTKEVKRPGED